MTTNQPKATITQLSEHTSTFSGAKRNSGASSAHVGLSVVIPLYNESRTLASLVEKLSKALDGRVYEILLVDDGSQDDSWHVIADLANQPGTAVRGFRHRRNFGKAEALSSGFKQAKGSVVVTLDADLQDDPAEIPALLAKLDEGYDVISGWKQRRQDPLSKTIPSRLFNLAARSVSGVKLHDLNCGLKAYRREALHELKLYGELHRFIPILLGAEGYRIAELPVRHFPREFGKSKYGWKRLAKGSLDLVTVVLLTRYSKRPAHFFGGIGMALGAIGIAILGYLSVMKLFFGEDIGPRPLFFFGMLLVLFAGQLISTGIIGEFLLRLRPGEGDGAQSTRRIDAVTDAPN